MEIGSEGLIILIAIVILSYFIIKIYNERDLMEITSSIDNEKYTVQIKDDSKEAADLIAQIKSKLNTLIEHLKKSYDGSDERIERLISNYRPDKMREGVDTPGYTSYSINKGEQIILCLRNEDELVDINTMMFVVLHEMGHLASESIGHTEEFWDNFKWLLEESINIGIYVKQDFETKSVEYCGMNITSTPLN
jgi:predicted metal-dependent hydrolase